MGGGADGREEAKPGPSMGRVGGGREEAKAGPAVGKVGVLGRMLRRQRWQRMEGLSAEDVDKAIPPPPPRRGNLHYRITGVKRWTPSWAALQDGHLHIYKTNTDAQPQVRLQLGMTVLEFEKKRQKVDVELGSGVFHHLNFHGTPEAEFEGWLLSFYLHRVFAQAEFLRGPTNKSEGSAIPPPVNPAIESSISSIAAQFRRAKHSFIKIRASHKPKKLKSWRLFKKPKSVKKTTAEVETEEMDTLMTKLEALITDIGRLSTLLETEGTRVPVTVVSAPVMDGARSSTAPLEQPRTPAEKAAAQPALPKATLDPAPITAPTVAPPAQPTSILLVKTHSATNIIDTPESSYKTYKEETTTLTGDLESEEDVDSAKEEMVEEKPEKPKETPLPCVVKAVVEVGPKVVEEPVKAKEEPRRAKEEVGNAKREESKSLAVSKREVGKKKERRRVLPSVMPPTLPITVGVVVRALAENSLPLRLFEPIGSLQRMAEQLEYSEILDRVMSEADPAQRMGLVTGYVVAGLSNSYKRTGKPFNPLLGETFAMDRWDDLGWRFNAEQVSHTPDISACCVEGKSGWRLTGVLKIGRPKLSFTYVSITPSGVFHLYLYGKIGETYRYQPLECRVQNPVSMTKRCIHHVGVLNISCSNGYSSSLKFSPSSLGVAGEVKNRAVTVGTLEGRWAETLRLKAGVSPPRTLFNVAPLPLDESLYFGFGLFSRELNEVGLDECHPPTDSRFRPDLRAFENGRLVDAQHFKELLEENQRKRRKGGKSAVLRWFALGSPGDFLTWTSNRRYWDAAATAFRGLTFTDLFSTRPLP